MSRPAESDRTKAVRAKRKSAAPAAADAQPQLRVMLRAVIAMGPGKAALLEAIDRSGSISAAARELGMSYRRAWLLLDTMNQSFRSPVIDTATGGSGGGGAHVTDMGRDIVRRYREMVAKATAAIASDLDEFIELMVTPPGK